MVFIFLMNYKYQHLEYLEGNITEEIYSNSKWNIGKGSFLNPNGLFAVKYLARYTSLLYNLLLYNDNKKTVLWSIQIENNINRGQNSLSQNYINISEGYSVTVFYEISQELLGWSVPNFSNNCFLFKNCQHKNILGWVTGQAKHLLPISFKFLR